MLPSSGIKLAQAPMCFNAYEAFSIGKVGGTDVSLDLSICFLPAEHCASVMVLLTSCLVPCFMDGFAFAIRVSTDISGILSMLSLENIYGPNECVFATRVVQAGFGN